jgi:hypothetical protein
MKLCPQCKTENPSDANCCMRCGAVLSEENLDEATRLQMDLNDANETVAYLKQLLETAQRDAKNEASKENRALQNQLLAKRQECESIAAEKDKQCSGFKVQVSRLQKQRKNSYLMCLLALLCVGIGIVVIIFYADENSRLISENEQRTNSVNENQSELNKRTTKVEAENRKLKLENRRLADGLNKNQIALNKQQTLEELMKKLREIFPLKITLVEFGNYDAGRMIDDYGSTLYSSKLRYLTPMIHFTNSLKAGKTFNFAIYYYDSKGKLKYSASAAEAPTSEKYISIVDNNVILNGWGAGYEGYWEADTYTAEIWSEGICLGSEEVTIH